MIWPPEIVSIVDGSYCQPFCSDLHVLRLGVNVVCQLSAILLRPPCNVIRFGVNVVCQFSAISLKSSCVSKCSFFFFFFFFFTKIQVYRYFHIHLLNAIQNTCNRYSKHMVPTNSNKSKLTTFKDLSRTKVLAATKQFYQWFSPSVTPFSLFPSSYHHEIYRSYYLWQKWDPYKISRSSIKGQGHRGQNPT